jgi:predicted ester cyclase
MPEADNMALSSRLLDELWNRRNLSIIDELIADQYIDRTPGVNLDDAAGLQGPEALKQLAQSYFDSFSDIHVTIENQACQGSQVATRMTWNVTLKLDDSPLDQQVTVMGVGMDHIVDGKIVENWNSLDALHRLRNIQLGGLAAGFIPRNPIRNCDSQHPCPQGFICVQGICGRM